MSLHKTFVFFVFILNVYLLEKYVKVKTKMLVKI